MYISLFFFLHMSVKGCEVSAVSWNFPRRHTNNTNCRSAVGAHRFIWHHRLQGQLEVINLQEGDSCVCVCVCVCVRDKWMKCTPPSYSHNTHTTQGPAPLCARPPFEVPPAAQRVNEEAAGGGRGPRNVLYVCVCVCVCVWWWQHVKMRPHAACLQLRGLSGNKSARVRVRGPMNLCYHEVC